MKRLSVLALALLPALLVMGQKDIPSFWYDPVKKAVFSSGNLSLTSREIPATDFPAVKNLFNRIDGEEAEKIVLNKP